MFWSLDYFTHKKDTEFITIYFFGSFDRRDSDSLEIRSFIGCH